jgi:hypothetical protein
MGFFNCVAKVSLTEKNRRIEELEKELKRYADALGEERKKLEQINNAARSSSFVFDFNAVKVFSIERNTSTGIPKTIIGYLLPEPVVVTDGETSTKDVVREWYLECDDKQHEIIVKAFKESIK